MRCPFCSHLEDRVVDSRLSREGDLIRRRRECAACGARFTTHERVEEVAMMVVKKDGRREPFDRQKVVAGIRMACRKRPVSTDVIERVVEDLEQQLQARGDREVASSEIGEQVMRALHDLDEVAYVRFASVYRQFQDMKEFRSALDKLLSDKFGGAAGGDPSP